MPFVKLDTSILVSSLWMERDARDIFITALLMARPREFAEAVEQLRVDRIEATGWAAPPGWYGFVDAAGIGIVDRAGVPTEAGMLALASLGEPDKWSRSQAFDGRRLIRVDGGFVMLNYIHYRERDHTSPARSRRWRERREEKNRHAVATRDVTVSTRDDTHADADADADADQRETRTVSRRRGKSSRSATPHGEAAGRILAHLNRLRSEAVPGSSLTDTQHIVRLLTARPDGEAEAITVLEHMAAEARQKGEWKWFTSSTPFRLEHFEGRLAQAQAAAPRRPGGTGFARAPGVVDDRQLTGDEAAAWLEAANASGSASAGHEAVIAMRGGR